MSVGNIEDEIVEQERLPGETQEDVDTLLEAAFAHFVAVAVSSREGQGWIVLAFSIGVLAGVVSRVYLGW